MRRNHIVGAALVLLAAGCGGSGSGVNSTPDPTPSPTPTPTPTPIPHGETPPELPPTTSGTLAQAYQTDQDFRTGSTEIVYDADAGTIQTRNKAYQSPTSIRIYYDAASDGYVVSNLDVENAFDFRGYVSYGDPNFFDYGSNFAEGTRNLLILRPDNKLIALTYTSFGEYRLNSSDRTDVTPRIDDNHFFYFGIPTAETDMPTTGTAHYDGIARGMLSTQDEDFDLSGTAALDVDFASGALTTAMQLQGNGRHTANPLTLPELDGVASITSGNAFLGTISTADNSYEGSVQGAFFGPQAKEFGYSWAINSPDLTKLGGGVAVGKR